MNERLKTSGLIGVLLAGVWGLTKIPGTTVNYHYECIEIGKVKAKRCVAAESKHVLNDATGNCIAQGSEYCHRCERYETVEEAGCVEWNRVERP